ncbi:IMS domain-containing protein [Spirulina subsalsa FACHB-351]|uniref:non-specific serine/threonine protein kinase n=1 Tax=Spirulina subsalsa FACHB-351 TaxID=234711 RepID=A0ABT3L3V6_9CYAN|nr:IMS domain-containing protein [Spirulina subsalsa]MCW6036183.1 IMS domain-containing protein [Spirulina subsalsa FACHB-351]
MSQTVIKNRYQIIRPLSSGGFGETFIVIDQDMPSGRQCVLKKLNPMTDDPKIYQLVQERFSREAAILEDLGKNHAQIPELYGYFEADSEFCLVQEWIVGQTLRQKVQEFGPFNESEIKTLLLDLLPVLEYVHSKRIVHRDIKPDNIILRGADNKPVLIDFGAVKETMGTVISPSGNSSRSIVIGTPGYMPSEQTAGRPVFASDLYSLGLTAIYGLTGKDPQELETDPSTGDIIWQHYAPKVSPTLAGILDKAIQTSPGERYRTAREMLAELNQGQVTAPVVMPTVQSNAPTTYPTPSPAPYPSPPPTYPAQAPTVVSNHTPSPPPPSGWSEWQKALITGSVIGLFVIGAIVMTRPQPAPVGTNSNTPEETSSSTGNPDDSSAESSPPSQQQYAGNNPVQNTSAISQNEALSVIRQWQQYKREIFAPPYRRSLGEEILTGQAFRSNIQQTDGTESSVDWLQNNNAYYSYGVQDIGEVKDFMSSGNNATLHVVVTEQRALYKDGRRSDQESAFDTRLVEYNLERVGGRVKIADYRTLSVLQRR